MRKTGYTCGTSDKKHRARQPGADLADDAALELLDFLPPALDIEQDGAGAHHERLAVHAERNALAMPLQQGNAKLLFQITQAARDGRLRQTIGARCGADAAGIGHRHQVAQLVQFHG